MSSRVGVQPGAKMIYEHPDQYGPIANRRCRDVFFLLLLIAFWAGMGWVGYQAYETGNPYRLLYGTDSFGNLCGFNNVGTGSFGNLSDMTNYPNLLYFNPTDAFAYRICVASCPNATALATPSTAICIYNTTISGSNAAEQAQSLLTQVTAGNCLGFTVASSSILNRCVPNFGADLSALSSSNSSLFNSTNANATASTGAVVALLDARNLFQTVVADFTNTWQWILIAGGLAVVASFLWLILLRLLAGVLVWSTILAILGGCGGLTYFTYELWQQNLTKLNSIPEAARTDDENFQERATFGIFIVVASISGILFLIILAMRKRINIAIEIIREASRAISAMPMIVFFPIPMFILMLVLFAYIVIGYMYLSTSQSAVQLPGASQGLVQYQDNNTIQYFQWYHLFGFLWGTQFLIGVTQCTIAGGVASYYWTLDKKHGIPRAPILKSLYRVIRYHLGSIALGSLIIAIVQFIRYILKRVEKVTRGKSNPVLKFVFKCLSCCFACVERFLKFLSKNAYIEIAIYGHSFCHAARVAFELLLRNAFRLITVDAISTFVLLLGKILICGAVGFAAYYKFKDMTELNFFAIPTAVCVIFAYIVATLFMYVYHMAIDTIFLCFCEDCERNDGITKPYYMSPSLQRITNQTNTVSPAKEYELVQAAPTAQYPVAVKKQKMEDGNEENNFSVRNM